MPKSLDTRSLQSSIGGSFSSQTPLISDHQARRLREERAYQNDDNVAPDTLDLLIAKQEARSRSTETIIIQKADMKSKATPGKPYKPPLKTDCTIHTHKKNRRTGDKIPITRGHIPTHHYHPDED